LSCYINQNSTTVFVHIFFVTWGKSSAQSFTHLPNRKWAFFLSCKRISRYFQFIVTILKFTKKHFLKPLIRWNGVKIHSPLTCYICREETSIWSFLFVRHPTAVFSPGLHQFCQKSVTNPSSLESQFLNCYQWVRTDMKMSFRFF